MATITNMFSSRTNNSVVEKIKVNEMMNSLENVRDALLLSIVMRLAEVNALMIFHQTLIVQYIMQIVSDIKLRYKVQSRTQSPRSSVLTKRNVVSGYEIV